MTIRERVRLPPSVFRLPVEKIREGYYSDAYFNLTKSAAGGRRSPPAGADAGLPAQGLDPRRDRRGDRRAQAGRRPLRGRPLGQRLGEPRGQGAARGRRDLPVGDRDDDRGRLLGLRAPRDRLPRRDGAPHADHAQRARGRRGRARQADPVLPRPPRPLAGADRRRLVGAHRRHDRRLDRRAGLLVGRARRRHGPARR